MPGAQNNYGLRILYEQGKLGPTQKAIYEATRKRGGKKGKRRGKACRCTCGGGKKGRPYRRRYKRKTRTSLKAAYATARRDLLVRQLAAVKRLRGNKKARGKKKARPRGAKRARDHGNELGAKRQRQDPFARLRNQKRKGAVEDGPFKRLR